MTAASRRPAQPTTALESFNQICTVRIELLGSDPLIWRQAEVPTSITLKVLHDIVQIAMGWLDCHFWQFTINGQRYGLQMDKDWDSPPRIEAVKTRLRDVLQPRQTTIEYLYDFGDSWEHRLTVMNVRQGEAGVSYPRYIGGDGAAPPEDCGGLSGFYEMLEARADPKHPDHAEIVEWLDGFDPAEIDELPLTIALGRIANRRHAARARLSANKRGSDQA